jgi:hypothetical protein
VTGYQAIDLTIGEILENFRTIVVEVTAETMSPFDNVRINELSEFFVLDEYNCGLEESLFVPFIKKIREHRGFHLRPLINPAQFDPEFLWRPWDADFQGGRLPRIDRF